MRGRVVRPAALGVALAAAVLTGCGGESEPEAAAEEQLAAGGAPTPVCVEEARGAEVPDSFPADFPLPDGAVVYGAEHRDQGRTIVYAVVDRGVKDVLAQLQESVPAAGFELTEGEVEERDAESSWTGNGWTGRWAIREVAGCPDQTSVTVLSARS